MDALKINTLKLDYLYSKHSHERDTLIEFDEGPHIYTVKEDPSQYTSVTTWNHSHFEHFGISSVVSV
jgi:hypothetical protein